MSDTEFTPNDVWVEEIAVDPAHLDTDLAALGWRRTGVKGVADVGQAMLSPDHSLINVRSDQPLSDVVEEAKREAEAETGDELDPAAVEAGEALLDFMTSLANAEYAVEGYEKLERIPQAAGGVR